MNKNILFRNIPKVDVLLEKPEIINLINNHHRDVVVDAIREEIDKLRNFIKENDDISLIEEKINNLVENIGINVEKVYSYNLRKVINGTGTILHTNLGRAIISKKHADYLSEVVTSYSNLEYNLEEGKRGERYSHFEKLICKITGAECAMAVNNNAAAVMLVLSSMAENKEVIVSRGELVEVGGKFRIPDVMKSSKAHLVEIGTTNKTHLEDYEDAISENTGAFLKVHTSNFKILGFTESVSIDELCKLGKEKEIPVIEDIGSGVLVDLSKYGLEYEPTVQDSIKAGVDIVSFSGDKLLGGPQAGIIVGKKKYIDKMKKNPLTRAFRIDKFTATILEMILHEYLSEEDAIKNIPVLSLITKDIKEIEESANAMSGQLNDSAETMNSQADAIESWISDSAEASVDASSVDAGVAAVSSQLEAAESALYNIDTSNMDDETAAAVEAAIDGALGSIQAAEDSASNIDTSTITASAPDTSALQSAADALRASASSAESTADAQEEAVNSSIEQMKQQLQALTQGMKTVQETVSQLNAGAKELTSNDGTLKASGTQLAQSGTQIATAVNQMSTLFTGLGQQLPEMLQGIDQLKAGSDQLTTANKSLQSGYESLAKASTEQMISGADTLLSSGKTLTDGIAQLQGENNVNAQTLLKGAKTLKSARKSLTSGMSQINSATGQITSGVETLASNSGTLYSGADQLSSNSSTLNSGASQLASGTQTLVSGAQTLASGTGSLVSGTQTLMDGADKLSDGSDQLKDGISDLNDGAKELNKGQKKFYKEGIKKLDDTVNGDLKDILDRFEVIQSDDVMYTTFTDRSGDMDGNVKFIFESDPIEISDDEK